MIKTDYEKAVTKAVAETFHFTLLDNGKWYKCDICGQRLSTNYVGMNINERMIQHWNNHHSRIRNLYHRRGL